MIPQTYISHHIDMLVEHRANEGCQFKEYLKNMPLSSQFNTYL